MFLVKTFWGRGLHFPGQGGRGVVNHFGLEGEVDIEIGSLSKAFSVMGGFIAVRQPQSIILDHFHAFLTTYDHAGARGVLLRARC